jgi:hypothetical protein
MVERVGMLGTYYALGKSRPKLDMTSAIQIVAERLTPTRQCTSVAVLSDLPRPSRITILVSDPHSIILLPVQAIQ